MTEAAAKIRARDYTTEPRAALPPLRGADDLAVTRSADGGQTAKTFITSSP